MPTMKRRMDEWVLRNLDRKGLALWAALRTGHFRLFVKLIRILSEVGR